MTDVETIPTVHGEVDVEITTCQYCGADVLAEEAVGVTAPARFARDWGGRLEVRGTRRRNFCPRCADELFGTASCHGAIPTGALDLFAARMVQLEDPVFAMIFGFFGALLAGGLVLCVGVLL